MKETRTRTGFIWPRRGTNGGHSNEPLISIKCGQLLGHLSNC